MIIVIAVTGILASIAIPSYQNHTLKAANRACLSETKAYSNAVINSIYGNRSPPAPPFGACSNITDASGWVTVTNLADITGTFKAPGDTNAVCDAANGGVCKQ